MFPRVKDAKFGKTLPLTKREIRNLSCSRKLLRDARSFSHWAWVEILNRLGEGLDRLGQALDELKP